MPIKKQRAVLAVSRITLTLAIVFGMDPSHADDRPPGYYLNDMRILACVTAENAVRARA